MNIESGMVGSGIEVIKITPWHDKPLKLNIISSVRSEFIQSEVAIVIYCAVLQTRICSLRFIGLSMGDYGELLLVWKLLLPPS